MKLITHISKVFSSPLSRQYLTWTFAFGTGLSLIITTAEVYFHYNSLNHELEANLARISETYTKALSQSLWDHHESQVQLIIDGIVIDNRVKAVEVKNGLLNLTSGQIPTDRLILKNENKLHFHYMSKSHFLGDFLVYADSGWAVEQSYEFTIARLFSNFTKSFAVILFAFFTFQTLVNRNLELISNFFSSEKPLHRPVHQLQLKRNALAYKGNDEIDEVVAAINSLNHKLHAHIDKIIEMNKEAEINNLRLSEAMRMEYLGKQTSSITHEFNNSLTIISAIIEQITNSNELPAELKEKLKIAESSAKTASQLTKGLLNYSQKTLSHTSVKLKDFSREIEPMLSVLIDKKNNFLVLCLTQKTVSINKETLTLCIINLVKNASESISDNGKISLIINELQEFDKKKCALPLDKSYINFAVIDDGTGIPKSLQDKMFEPFVSTKPKQKGTGLGLWTVRNFVNQIDGLIYYQDAIKGGSHFNLIIPIN